jgi:hypothetical protein
VNRRWILLTLLVVVVLTVGLWFSRVRDRYHFCRVRFGTDHDSATVLFARTSSSLHLYRSGHVDDPAEAYQLRDGKLPPDARIPSWTLANGTTYSIVEVAGYTDDSPPLRNALLVHVRIDDAESSFVEYCDIELSDSPETAKCAEIDAPLSVRLVPIDPETSTQLVFTVGGEPTTVECVVGSFDKKRDVWTVLNNDHSTFSGETRPYLTIEYQTAAGKLATFTAPLTQSRCRSVFYDNIQLPEDGVAGIAKLTLDMDSFSARHVSPTTQMVTLVSK